jgi:hypothetical protein
MAEERRKKTKQRKEQKKDISPTRKYDFVCGQGYTVGN